MRWKSFLLLFLAWAGLAACVNSHAAATPSLVQTATPTPPPAVTDTPLATSALPTATRITPGNGLNKPLEDWNGIPIMQGASYGNGDRNNYRFQIAKPMVDVQTFYGGVMPNLGWKFVSSTNTSGAMRYVYQQGTNFITMAISQQAAFTVVVFTQGK